MTAPDRDFSCVPAVRSQIIQAEEKLTIAARLMRTHGLIDSADEIVGRVKWLRTWTGPDVILDWFEKPSTPDEQKDIFS